MWKPIASPPTRWLYPAGLRRTTTVRISPHASKLPGLWRNEPTGTTVCEKCYAATDPNAVYSDKNRTTALVLALLLGIVGGHRFYVGKTGMGILYIFTGGLFGIGVLVDVIKIITGDSRDSNGYPLRKGCFI